MSNFLEQLIVYSLVFFICAITIYFYIKGVNKKSKQTKIKVAQAKIDGLFEPISLHPYIDLNTCIGSTACISACPEKDILGVIDGKATVVKTSNCIGHGACFHSCPVEAISLKIGTESRGIDLPHVNEKFETNIKGIYIAGELGGMGLIKNSVEQGKQAISNLYKRKNDDKEIDVVIIGAGPAGLSATLMAKKLGLSSVTLEQDTLGGTVYTFPRAKIVMTSPMDLPLYGKIKLTETSKDELLQLWNKVISENNLKILEKTKVKKIIPIENENFKVETEDEQTFICNNVLLAIGRRGTPRKLNIPGENLQKVAYRLLEPERILNKKVLVVGGGDSAIESALLLIDNNEVCLSYRKDKFSRLKPKNKEKIDLAIKNEKIKVIYSSNLTEIKESDILLQLDTEESSELMTNDLVFIFAGGELPTKFLQSFGVNITKRFGHILKKHG